MFVGIYKEISIPGLLRWCRGLSTHGIAFGFGGLERVLGFPFGLASTRNMACFPLVRLCSGCVPFPVNHLGACGSGVASLLRLV